jgi:hypothetical protein
MDQTPLESARLDTLHPNSLNAPTTCRDVHRAFVESETTEITGWLDWEMRVQVDGKAWKAKDIAVYFFSLLWPLRVVGELHFLSIFLF